MIEAESPELTQGMDRLIAASREPNGTLALLDASGQITVHRPSLGQRWRLEVQLPNPAGDLAVTEGLAYVLFQGQLSEGAAVAAYTFRGEQVGHWGRMPPGAIIQSNLSGGGIAACQDGRVFYSYINDPQISRLEAGGGVRPVGKPPASFEAIAPRHVRRAYEESLETHSVAPLVKTGLGASRVMTLLCSEDGLLLRQVAQPHKAGARIEIWNPVSEELLGVIPVGRSVLLDVRERILYLATSSERERITVDRIRYDVEIQK